MTRGNKREKDRARAEARKVKGAGGKAAKGKKEDKVCKEGMTDAEKLQAKIASKKKLKEEGKLEVKDRGSKFVAKGKVESVINPHTGKKDPEYTKKLLMKQGK